MPWRHPAALALAAGWALAWVPPSPAAWLAPVSEMPDAGDVADDQPDPSVLENRPIRAVRFVEPDPNADDPAAVRPLEGSIAQLVRNQVRLVPGGLYLGATAQADVRRISRLGRFSRAETRVALLEDGSVEVSYVLWPEPVIRDVQVVGNERVSTTDIAEVVGPLLGTTADRFQLDRAVRQIEDLYRAKGFARANIEYDLSELDDTGVILFRVTEAERIRVTDIRFEGNESFKPGEIKAQIKTSVAGIFNKGVLDEERLNEDVAAIAKFYRDRGYIDVEVDRLPPQISPDGKEAIVTFVIREGPQYTFRNVQVLYPESVREVFDTREAALDAAAPGEEVVPVGAGRYAVFHAAPYSSAQIAGIMELKTGAVFDTVKVSRSMRQIEVAFGKLGYVNVTEGSGRFDRRELRDPDAPGKVDLLLTFRPGEPVRTGEVKIVGNELTDQKVIRRGIQVRPDRPLDSTAVERSQVALTRSGLFDNQANPPRLTIQPEDPSFPGYRDILAEVRETNTGAFNIGGVISSDSGLTGRLSYVQRNFDVTDTPDSLGEFFTGRSFRGGGQTFRAEALPGTEVQTFLISLSEPSLFESDYSGSVQASFRRRQFSQFDEERATLRLTAGRRFGQRWVGQTSLRVENVELSDIDEESPTDIFEDEGSNFITGLSFQLSRSTLDHPFTPGRGMRTAIALEQVGIFGGDYQFTKLRLENVVFVTLEQDFFERNTTLSLTTEAAWIPQGQSSTPVFERLYRGGRTFRGFDYRAIAPIGIRQDNGEQSDDTVGGTFEFFAGLEYTKPILGDTVAGILFLDTGTVTDEIGFSEYRVSAGFGIRLITPLSPAPIAMDFGFPILSEGPDAERVFTFTIDVPF